MKEIHPGTTDKRDETRGEGRGRLLEDLSPPDGVLVILGPDMGVYDRVPTRALMYLSVYILDFIGKRVFLGGLAPNITSKDLQERFQSFGTVSRIQVANDATGDFHRGFAHFDLQTSEAQWKRLVTAYNGSNWRGGKLRIDEARQDYMARLRENDAAPPPPVKRKRKLVRERGDKTLMTDALVDKRPDWKRSRYGRAVAMLKMRRPDGKMITIDPSHYKENIEKLFGSVKPLPISKLTWSVAEDATVNDSEAESLSDSDVEITRPASTSCSTVEQTKQADLSVEEEVGFSLSKLLGLEPSLPEEADADLKKLDENREAEVTLPTDTLIDLPSLLFNLSRLDSLPLEEYAFCRRCGREEAYTLWREKRAELRADFKARLKQAKKLARRKPVKH
ncbi:hypothetical protein PSACC_03464 [Paramicrosporidium saccamoebae]|uniref:RRM domain-containing protein n=1 Tax=Paramicrosporidium saccamoebae TaxID=1246581 RepID=A0A2H9TG15_9FUNG|nr:hypothetical protein PSACC_03464 [Paramicrosporidium saccamoebae]